MDINGLSAYTDLYQTQVSQSTSKLENELKSDYAQATNDELMDACKEFEAYFVEQMFKEMMKTIPESETTSSYTSNLMDYYKDSMVQEIASDSTEQNSLGLAQMLYEQMKRNYGL
ncbi:MAG: rod-binding protein [Lachnospiraceae bacterium]|nr:rod-binding protein [Lachnospiraceae bacterium]MBQ7782189.1 rod-binding protein [Lachnospiraceae bacterium]